MLRAGISSSTRSARRIGLGRPFSTPSSSSSSSSSTSGIRLGKNRPVAPTSPPHHQHAPVPTYTQPPPQQVPQQPPPQYYYQQQQQQEPPMTFGQSLVQYLILGFAITVGISMVRMVFSEGKYVGNDRVLGGEVEEGGNADEADE